MILKLTERIELLAELGRYLLEEPDEDLEQVIQKSYLENRWFTPENTRQALRSIAEAFLDPVKLRDWVGNYPLSDQPASGKAIALIMAGNIPLVGFHDWLCVFVSGHRAKVKLSEKDRFLLPFLVKKIAEWKFESWAETEFLAESDKLSGFDAVIATGSNNTARYFEQYFGKYPHVIRRNRNGVAVLGGQETPAELYALGNDIFSYFGLGCRNVSKLYVPEGYDFIPLLEVLHDYRDIIHHDKYKNNFDYNLTLFILNNIPYQNNGCLLLKEDPALSSRIASVHFEYYHELSELMQLLDAQQEEIQCIVSTLKLPGRVVFSPGEAQKPGLFDYADAVDVMSFLTSL